MNYAIVIVFFQNVSRLPNSILLYIVSQIIICLHIFSVVGKKRFILMIFVQFHLLIVDPEKLFTFFLFLLSIDKHNAMDSLLFDETWRILDPIKTCLSSLITQSFCPISSHVYLPVCVISMSSPAGLPVCRPPAYSDEPVGIAWELRGDSVGRWRRC